MPEHEEEVGPSRSKKRAVRKDQGARLESVGLRLTTLTERAFESLELGDAMAREVSLLATLSTGSAFSRQRRRVAGLLRELDLDELEQRVERAALAPGAGQATTYRLERLRRELIKGDDVVLGRLFDANPAMDRPRLHQALRAARREADTGISGRRFKELFQLLKELELPEA